MSAYIIPILLIALFVYTLIKGGKSYDIFVEGVKKAFPLVLSIFPYLVAVFIMTFLFEKSGLSSAIIDLSADFFQFFGINKALVPLVLLKPFSGSGSLSILSNIMSTYGVDSYIARCACCIYGSSETVFYVGAVYYSKCKNKPPVLPFIISLISNFVATVFACFICKIL